MLLKNYTVDAFVSGKFKGNPAGVVPLDEWLDEDVMQQIAADNALSETAFFVGEMGVYYLRWMTPTNEVALCGHATLAASYIIFNHLETDLTKIRFETKSGELQVIKKEDLLEMDFPVTKSIIDPEPPGELMQLFTKQPVEIWKADSYTAVFENEEDIRNIKINTDALAKIDCHGLIVTAKGNEADFVSRFFTPQNGIAEDPVTGYAHTVLVPIWREKINKKNFTAHQLSERGGELFLEDMMERVRIAGRAKLTNESEIEV